MTWNPPAVAPILESAKAEAKSEHDRAVETDRRQTSEIARLSARQAEQDLEIESLHAAASRDRQRVDDAAEAARMELDKTQTRIAELAAKINASREARKQIRGLPPASAFSFRPDESNDPMFMKARFGHGQRIRSDHVSSPSAGFDQEQTTITSPAE